MSSKCFANIRYQSLQYDKPICLLHSTNKITHKTL